MKFTLPAPATENSEKNSEKSSKKSSKRHRKSSVPNSDWLVEVVPSDPRSSAQDCSRPDRLRFWPALEARAAAAAAAAEGSESYRQEKEEL